MSSATAIDVKEISFKRKDKTIFSKLSFCLKEGQILSLLGPSGSGKSSMLRCLAGLDNPSEGEIFIFGKKVFGENFCCPPEHRAVGFVPQDLALFPHLSVKDNIIFGAKEKKNLDKQWLHELCERFELKELIEVFPHEISGGQAQRVAIARALFLKPKIILMDEPLSQLDSQLRLNILAFLKSHVAQEKIALIMTSHHLEDVYDYSDILAVLKDTRFAKLGAPHELYVRPQKIF